MILRIGILSLLLVLAAVASPLAAEHGAAVFPSSTRVQVTDSFWKPILERNRDITIPHNLAKCREVGIVANFERVAGLKEGDYHGLLNWDEFLYKAIEAGCYALAEKHDEALERELDEIIAVIAKAQDEDGYLRTNTQLSERGRGPHGLKRWEDLGGNLELYCSGHLFEAAVAHYQATGKRTLLDVALKNAALVDQLFGPGKRVDVGGHEEIELALVRLAEATDDERWLRLAKFFVDTRGTEAGGRQRRGEFSQDHLPLFEQTEAVGQAPRATYFYSAAADIGRATGDSRYYRALRQLWQDVVGRKMYVTGGIGSRHDNEGFGEPYDLPNLTAYTEVCAAISFPLWAKRMFQLDPRGEYFDVIERTLYNNLLAGVSLSGDRYFYACPPESDGKLKFNIGWLPSEAKGIPYSDKSATRKEWFPCACCPPNLARYLPQIPSLAYSSSDDALWVNLFIGSEAEVGPPGASWQVRQETEYPWKGNVKLVIVRPVPAGDGDSEPTVRIRIPGWARNQPVPSDLYRFSGPSDELTTTTVNGEPAEWSLDDGYASLQRRWSAGDVVEVEFPMPVRRIVAHQNVRENAGKVVLQRGPIIFSLEGVDHDGRVLDLTLSDSTMLAPKWEPEFLGGVMTLWGTAQRDGKQVPVRAIPHFAWANRGVTEMVTWIKQNPQARQASAGPKDADTSQQQPAGNRRPKTS